MADRILESLTGVGKEKWRALVDSNHRPIA
mgnify:FL=1|jgi:hypothetical protein